MPSKTRLERRYLQLFSWWRCRSECTNRRQPPQYILAGVHPASLTIIRSGPLKISPKRPDSAMDQLYQQTISDIVFFLYMFIAIYIFFKGIFFLLFFSVVPPRYLSPRLPVCDFRCIFTSAPRPTPSLNVIARDFGQDLKRFWGKLLYLRIPISLCTLIWLSFFFCLVTNRRYE